MPNTYVKINFKEIKSDLALSKLLNIKDYIIDNQSIIDNFEIIYNMNNINNKIMDPSNFDKDINLDPNSCINVKDINAPNICINNGNILNDSVEKDILSKLEEISEPGILESKVDNDDIESTSRDKKSEIEEIFDLIKDDINKILSKYCMEYSWMPVSNEKYPVFRGDGFKVNLLCDYNRLCKISKEVINKISKYIPELLSINSDKSNDFISILETLKLNHSMNPANLDVILHCLKLAYSFDLNYEVKYERDGLYKIIRYPSDSYEQLDLLINRLRVNKLQIKCSDESISIINRYNRFNNSLIEIFNKIASIIRSDEFPMGLVLEEIKNDDSINAKYAIVINNINIINELLITIGFPYKFKLEDDILSIEISVEVIDDMISNNPPSLSSFVTSDLDQNISIKENNQNISDNTDIKNKIIEELTSYAKNGFCEYYTMKKIVQKLLKLISKYDNSEIMLNPDGDINNNIDFINNWLLKREINYEIVKYYPFSTYKMNVYNVYKIIQTKSE